jgi:hypothetical protein
MLTVALMILGEVDPGAVVDKLSTGTVAQVLAVIVVAQFIVIGLVVRQYLGEVAGRREDQKEHHAETVGMLTSVVQLNVKTNDAFDVLEDAIELAEKRS